MEQSRAPLEPPWGPLAGFGGPSEGAQARDSFGRSPHVYFARLAGMHGLTGRTREAAVLSSAAEGATYGATKSGPLYSRRRRAQPLAQPTEGTTWFGPPRAAGTIWFGLPRVADTVWFCAF